MKGWPTLKPASRPPSTKEERDFVRAFGTKAINVKYVGRRDMLGLEMVGNIHGIAVEKLDDEAVLRLLEVRNGYIVRTNRYYKMKSLRPGGTHSYAIPGLRKFVR